MRFIAAIAAIPAAARAAAGLRGTAIRFTLWAALGALALPSFAWAGGHCESINVTAGAVRNRADIRAFVECAYAYAMENGTEEAGRAFREDERWRSDSIYVFVDQQAPSGAEATSYVFPPDTSREGQPWGPLVDEFGTDYFVEATRIFDVLGGESGAGGWMYYSFTNPASGRSEPKASYLIALDWDGAPAMIGAGVYQRDIPAACYPEEVNAMQLDAMPDDMQLAQFVRCAALVIESKGFFGVAELLTERWRSGSVYVFGVDAGSGVQLFTSNPATVNGRQMMEGLDDRDPMGRFAGRDAPAVGAAFGEAYLYYDGFNPAAGGAQGKVAFVKRVMAQGTPVLVGAGYYPGATAPVTPPFAPVERVVELGDSGETVTLVTAAGGGFELGGEPVRSGDIREFGGAMYRLVLEGGTWTATLVPPDGGPSGEPAVGATWTNALGMEFVGVPAGTFVMGSPEGEEGRFNDEGPHEVTLSQGFWMGKHEVTQGEWEAVMGSNPSYFTACGAECPVEQVSWEDIQGFMARLNEREAAAGSTSRYRLPTEAEWEYAARAGSAAATPEGELRIFGFRNAPVLDGQAWYGGNSGVAYEGGWDCSGWEEKQHESERCGTHPVGQKRANGWGLHDMLGNVWEWVSDWYGRYPSGAVTDPTGPGSGSSRVRRGGSWIDAARSVRSATRYYTFAPGARYFTLGFRLVRTN